jgi:hypothetical protein
MFSQVSFNLVVGLLVRGLLAMAAGWLASHKILDQSDTAQWIEAATLMVVAFGWSYLEKYQGKQTQDTLIATAIQMPPSATVADVHATVDEGFGATPAAKIAPVLLLCLALPLLGASTTGCAPKNATFDTPTTATMYHAEQAIKDLGKVRNFSVDLLDQKVITVQQFRWVVQLIDVGDAALEKAGGGWKDMLSTGAWEAALKEIPELGPMPTTWQGAARQVWAVIKLKVPTLTTSGGWSVVAGAVDGALANLGG